MEREIEWRMHAVRADFQEIGQRLSVNPVVARVIVNRGQDTAGKQEKYLYGTLDDLPDPELLLGCSRAAEILEQKIREGKRIRIVSDYDVDGVTSNYVLLDALRRLGAEVSYDIPDRVTDGYGMNERIVDQAAEDGVDTILTCDNGVAAFAAVNRAKELGMTVIVTDHHQIQGILPEADVVIDPWQEGCPYPYKDICGVEVAYKLMQVLARRMGNPLGRMDYLEFVALGTVCDVMPIQEENRIIVREGLRAMERTENTGLRALLSVNGLLDGRKITVYHLGFIIGPSINSEGRLSSAKEAMDLLLMKNPDKAEQKALEIRDLNESRKTATLKGMDYATGYLEGTGLWQRDRVILICIPNLHESLAGIVAGRLRERYYRPVIVLTGTEADPDMLKGSGRSIPAYNMFERLSEVKDLLDHFGGHKAAAGLSLRKDRLEDLRQALNEKCGLSDEDLIEKVFFDVPMPLSYASLPMAEQLFYLEPFGTGNPGPLFAERDLEVVDYRLLGKAGTTARLRLRDVRGNVSQILAFQSDDLIRNIKLWSEEAECDKIGKYVRIDVMYKVSVNEYRGVRSAECILEHYRKRTE